jgi:phosphomannomutase
MTTSANNPAANIASGNPAQASAPLTAFKAYDIRGQLGSEMTEDIAYRIARAYAQHIGVDSGAKTVVLGGDIRATSAMLKAALARGLMDSGCNVIDLGMTGTEEVYHAAFTLDVDGGIEVTASHNPMDYNGMKLVARGAVPISADSGLKAIRALAEKNDFPPLPADQRGTYIELNLRSAYIAHLLTYIDVPELARLTQAKPLKLVVNAGNGAAGPTLDALEAALHAQGVNIHFVKVNHTPDATFPNGIPNPLLPENRSATAQAVVQHGADMGIAWDGDFDRCFLFDHTGGFVEGYYIVGLLAQAFLAKRPGATIVYDPRLSWNTLDIVAQGGGKAVQSKAGHAFIKEQMRKVDGVYGGEMSAHHYFKDFGFCDSGMIPWLLVIEMLAKTGHSLASMVNERIAAYPCSGELNYTVRNVPAAIQAIRQHFETLDANNPPHIDTTDGLSMAWSDWRFNVRGSNTEPLLRLNVESRGDLALMMKKTAALEARINFFENTHAVLRNNTQL